MNRESANTLVRVAKKLLDRRKLFECSLILRNKAMVATSIKREYHKRLFCVVLGDKGSQVLTLNASRNKKEKNSAKIKVKSSGRFLSSVRKKLKTKNMAKREIEVANIFWYLSIFFLFIWLSQLSLKVKAKYVKDIEKIRSISFSKSFRNRELRK
jgi:hypothetical protein